MKRYKNEHESAGVFDKKDQRFMNIVFYGCLALIVIIIGLAIIAIVI